MIGLICDGEMIKGRIKVRNSYAQPQSDAKGVGDQPFYAVYGYCVLCSSEKLEKFPEMQD